MLINKFIRGREVGLLFRERSKFLVKLSFVYEINIRFYLNVSLYLCGFGLNVFGNIGKYFKIY